MAVNLELEGIVAKDCRSTYQAGRSTGWQKIKTAMGVERERQRRRE
jgi:ATP-dependent DNA ligase